MAEHLLLVEQQGDWKPGYPRLPLVTARDYLAGGELAAKRDLRVINLCRSYRYLSLAYYCSLLAEARGHKVIPTVRTIQELSSREIYGLETEELNALAQRLLGRRKTTALAPTAYELTTCFGQCDVKELQPLARQIFETFRCPILKVAFRLQGTWRIGAIKALPIASLGDGTDSPFFAALEGYLSKRWRQRRARLSYRYDLAILHDPAEELPPSDAKALARVVKAEDHVGLSRIAAKLFKESDLILAQEFLYTPFDWRIGILGRKPFYACKYLMSRDHWQIVKHELDGGHEEGGFETLAIEDVPPAVIKTALRAADLIGDGLYGVDLKETSAGPVVIEVNDNPSLDADVEDKVLGDELYARLIGELVERLDRRRIRKT